MMIQGKGVGWRLSIWLLLWAMSNPTLAVTRPAGEKPLPLRIVPTDVDSGDVIGLTGKLAPSSKQTKKIKSSRTTEPTEQSQPSSSQCKSGNLNGFGVDQCQ